MNKELAFGKVKDKGQNTGEFFLSAPSSHYDRATGLTDDVRHVIRIPAESLEWLALNALAALSPEQREFVTVGLEEAI